MGLFRNRKRKAYGSFLFLFYTPDPSLLRSLMVSETQITLQITSRIFRCVLPMTHLEFEDIRHRKMIDNFQISKKSVQKRTDERGELESLLMIGYIENQ